MIVVTDSKGREFRYPDPESFAEVASSPTKPWTGLVQVREIAVVRRWPRKLVK